MALMSGHHLNKIRDLQTSEPNSHGLFFHLFIPIFDDATLREPRGREYIVIYFKMLCSCIVPTNRDVVALLLLGHYFGDEPICFKLVTSQCPLASFAAII